MTATDLLLYPMSDATDHPVCDKCDAEMNLYCFEQNISFRAGLISLGFNVIREALSNVTISTESDSHRGSAISAALSTFV